ncbi:uncharacterized protein LOC126812430 isoform X2 [Patella vulgata]|nr:uncharacterized protein LOC126812430 isoform X2 [Patella vulgata]
MHVKMEDAMAACGKRFPILAKYKVGHEKNGRILAVIVDLYCDMGWKASAAFFPFEIMTKLDQGYNIENWLIRPHLVRTHKPPQNACRSPACFPAGFIIESIVEHVASIVKQHPILVKELNLYQEGQVDINGDILNYCTLPTLWKQLKQMADVNNRLEEIKQYNKLNTWKKRGLTMTPVKYGLNGFPFRFTCDISIYGSDGTINISQGGVEMGQGLYTKVVQAVAATLNVPISIIKIRPCSTLIAPNNLSTGNSVGSELCVQAAIECCEILKKRMLPVQEANCNLNWVALCDKCYMSCVDLTAKYTQFGINSKDSYYKYFTYAAGVTEVEVDILTGENHLRRVDILFDCGESLNPTIDIGQIEGAYVMGLGAMLTEDTIYNPETGQVLNNGTWDYKPPTSKDIPIDWRIHLLSDAPNPVGIKGSKAAGEPPIVLSTGSLFAIKQAVNSFNDENNSMEFSPTVAPLTVEKVQQSCAIISSNLTLYKTQLHNTARL